ncbi:MAG: hypothetical protein SGI86_07895 [Deltaproteobacteria bacterium]|nr:hypothetical protein [Deltaproteobacteria bacterium]
MNRLHLSRITARPAAMAIAFAISCLTAASASADPHEAPHPDHQSVIKKWGVEARRMATLNASGNSLDPRCDKAGTVANEPCAVEMTAIGVRHWMTDHYAWNAALAISAGGGSTSTSAGNGGSWDTYLGFGPIVGANFLLAQTRHLAVSAMPQLGLLAFLPSGSGTKTFMVDARALIEAEIHLGMIGLPQISVGTSAGLGISWVKKTEGDAGKDVVGGLPGTSPFAAWSVQGVGPQNLWGLVNNTFIRFYF